LDFRFNVDLPRARIVDLASCAFIDKREDVIFVGPTGTGKSHLARALGHRACRLGRSVSSFRPRSCSAASTQPAATAPSTESCSGSSISTCS
jgi:ABC-type iron transport system FetAB ATPase subunit